MDLEYTGCALCGSGTATFLLKAHLEPYDTKLPVSELTLVRCRVCGLVFVNPRPPAEAFESEYEENYFSSETMRFYATPSGKNTTESHFTTISPGSEPRFAPATPVQTNESFELRHALISSIKHTGKLLDIGCAAGGFMLFMKNRGYETYGVEISRYASSKARELGLDVFNGRIENAPYKDEFFDIVHAGDILEHIHEPRAFLRKIWSLLSPGGILYIAVPDFSGLVFRLYRLLNFFNKKNYFLLPYHLYHFTPQTLSRMLAVSGFRVEMIAGSHSRFSGSPFKQLIMSAVNSLADKLKMPDRILCISSKMKGWT